MVEKISKSVTTYEKNNASLFANRCIACNSFFTTLPQRQGESGKFACRLQSASGKCLPRSQSTNRQHHATPRWSVANGNSLGRFLHSVCRCLRGLYHSVCRRFPWSDQKKQCFAGCFVAIKRTNRFRIVNIVFHCCCFRLAQSQGASQFRIRRGGRRGFFLYSSEASRTQISDPRSSTDCRFVARLAVKIQFRKCFPKP